MYYYNSKNSKYQGYFKNNEDIWRVVNFDFGIVVNVKVVWYNKTDEGFIR